MFRNRRDGARHLEVLARARQDLLVVQAAVNHVDVIHAHERRARRPRVARRQRLESVTTTSGRHSSTAAIHVRTLLGSSRASAATVPFTDAQRRISPCSIASDGPKLTECEGLTA